MGEGLLKNWITAGTDTPFYARKEIELTNVPQKATACVCGLGQFNFYVNGEKVSDHVLDPAWTDYNKVVYYVKFDITGYLKKGKNVLAAEVGNGWYLADKSGGYFFHFPSFMPPNPNDYVPFNKDLVLAVHVELSDADGSVSVIDTDETWKVAEHPVQHSNCFGSEIIDGRKKLPGWNTCVRTGSGKTSDSCIQTESGKSSDGVEEHLKEKVSKESHVPEKDGIWRRASISAKSKELSALAEEQTIPPVKVIRSYPGKYLKTVGGHAIYDFGQNVSGMLSLEVRGKAGEEVHILPAEKLTETGDVDQLAKNWLPIDVCETFILAEDNTWESFGMTFTYFGGRYIGIDCDPENTRNIELHAISSAGERAGEFQCDDERFLQIYDLVEKSVEANMVGVHTDCPTIERFAWQEENHLMAPSIMYMKQVKAHWEKFLKDTRLAQLTADDWFHDMHHGKYYPGDGLIPSQAPCYLPNVLPVPGLGDFYNVIGWGSSIILGTYWHYQFYGDPKIVEDNYEAGKKYLEFLKTMVTEDGFINNGLGDWGNPVGEFARENVETAFLFADAKILTEFAELLGKEDDAKAFAAYAEKVKENYNEKLLVFNQETGRYCYKVWDKKEGIVTTQATQAMPLFWGIVPKEREEDVVETLRQTLLADGSLKTGEVAQPYIIQTMSRYNMNDLLCEMILKQEHPSYYAFVLAGETTLGEYWEENPRSHCHDMMGHIIEWYYNGIAGIKPLEPGFKKVLVKPYLPASMNEMNCIYHSASGKISVSMKRTGSGIDLQVLADDAIAVTVDRSNL